MREGNTQRLHAAVYRQRIDVSMDNGTRTLDLCEADRSDGVMGESLLWAVAFKFLQFRIAIALMEFASKRYFSFRLNFGQLEDIWIGVCGGCCS